jgi:hypothetical protein
MSSGSGRSYREGRASLSRMREDAHHVRALLAEQQVRAQPAGSVDCGDNNHCDCESQSTRTCKAHLDLMLLPCNPWMMHPLLQAPIPSCCLNSWLIVSLVTFPHVVHAG